MKKRCLDEQKGDELLSGITGPRLIAAAAAAVAAAATKDFFPVPK